MVKSGSKDSDLEQSDNLVSGAYQLEHAS